jgi:hypothetical protein
MTDFMQRQFDISQELIRMMYKDAEERARLYEQMNLLIAEKDKQIAKLQSTIEAMNVMQGNTNV